MLHALLFVILLGAVFVILYYLCNKVGGTSAMKIKTSFLFIALGLHYL